MTTQRPGRPSRRGQRAQVRDGMKPGERRSARVRRRLANANFASAIYGQILVLSVLAALAVHDQTVPAGTVLLAVVSSQLVFWLAHAYAETLGQQLQSETGIGRAGISEIMEHEWPMVQAAFPTIILMLLSLAGAFSAETAIDIAVIISIVQLLGWGISVGRRSNQPVIGQLITGLLSGTFGLVIVALKYLVH